MPLTPAIALTTAVYMGTDKNKGYKALHRPRSIGKKLILPLVVFGLVKSM
jgi:hypothetical protein